MSKFNFHLTNNDDLILVEAFIENYPLISALDTAASQTVIDWNALFLAGCAVPAEADFKNTVPVETAAGMMHVPIYELSQIRVLGLEKTVFPILTYDFLTKGITSPYDGVLGLDFFRNKGILTIDFINEQLWFV